MCDGSAHSSGCVVNGSNAMAAFCHCQQAYNGFSHPPPPLSLSPSLSLSLSLSLSQTAEVAAQFRQNTATSNTGRRISGTSPQRRRRSNLSQLLATPLYIDPNSYVFTMYTSECITFYIHSTLWCTHTHAHTHTHTHTHCYSTDFKLYAI